MKRFHLPSFSPAMLMLYNHHEKPLDANFPGPSNIFVKMMHFIFDNGNDVPRCDLFNAFESYLCMSTLQNCNIIGYSHNNDTFRLTPEGLEIMEFTDHFKEIYQFLEFLIEAKVSSNASSEEIDVILTLSGMNHSFMNDRFACRIEMAFSRPDCGLFITGPGLTAGLDICLLIHEMLHNERFENIIRNMLGIGHCKM